MFLLSRDGKTTLKEDSVEIQSVKHAKMKRPKDYVGERALDKVSVDLSVYDIPLRDVGYEAPSGRRLLSVDCSTVALMRGHNYGVYLLRVAYAFLEPRRGGGLTATSRTTSWPL